MGLTATANIQSHRFQDAVLGLFDAPAKAVHAGKVFAVGVIALPFSFNRNGITVEGHLLGRWLFRILRNYTPLLLRWMISD
jgi:hypothetical protein